MKLANKRNNLDIQTKCVKSKKESIKELDIERSDQKKTDTLKLHEKLKEKKEELKLNISLIKPVEEYNELYKLPLNSEIQRDSTKLFGEFFEESAYPQTNKEQYTQINVKRNVSNIYRNNVNLK